MANELQTKLDAILLDKNTNLLPENLKAGVNCLGVNGTLNDVDTSDATAVAEDIYKNKTAYVNGEKVIGTMDGMDNQQYWRASKVTIESGWSDLNSNRVVLTSTPPYGKTLRWYSGTELRLHAGWVDIANAIGLTADKIKAGETILGITGTYTG